MTQKTDQTSKTILVVDDEADLRETIGFVLESEGFQVSMAGSGKEAIEIIKKDHIDLVVSDVRMPEGSGIELLQWVRERDYLVPPVLLITGFADLSVEDAHELGANGVIQKPFRSRALLDAIHQALLPLGEAWAMQPEGPYAQLNVRLQYSDMKMAIGGCAVNVGRGGLSVALQDDFPELNSKISFVLEFQDGSPKEVIRGTGIVRWVRALPKPNLPAGCGIEITFLDETHRSVMLNVIEQIKPKAFIPKMFAKKNA